MIWRLLLSDRRRLVAALCATALVLPAASARAALRDDALAAARQATTFYWKQVSTEGGYLWRYSADLKLREGEGKQKNTVVWVQPPGTPAVGEAYVRLYEATGEPLYLDAARAAADALRRGQLRSGGWNNGIDFDPAGRTIEAYRVEPPGKKRRNHSSLDDDKTQSVLRFLARLDRALKFKDEQVHEMTTFGLDALLAAQLPNGGFAQTWGEPCDNVYPTKVARYPKTWSRTYPGHQNYWNLATLNDDLMQDVLDTLFLAEDVYADARFRQAAVRAADFLLLAQLPAPQPAWAQQYDADMQPVWARKFEPPAVSGWESQGVLKILMQVYRRTGDAKYLEPIPRALSYLQKSKLPDGRLARFNELQTNRPLYFTREYVLTHDDGDVPTHYGFKVESKLDAIEREFQALKKAASEPLKTAAAQDRPQPPSAEMQDRVRRAIAALDDHGAWLTDDGLRFQKHTGPVINMQVAVDNLNLLADYLAATKP